MQTFLPYESFLKSARCLDNKRLGKQRVEAWQILNTLLGKSEGWKNHPAVKQWEGSEHWLCLYGAVCCYEWTTRGFSDSLQDKFCLNAGLLFSNDTYPSWLGNEEYHASHRSNLLRKDPEWYGQFGWVEADNLPYYWPSKHMEK